MINQKPSIPESLLLRKIPWGPIGKQVYQRTYSHDYSDGGKESWPETVVRAVDGNLGLVSPRFHEEGEREKLIELMMNFSLIPGGRHIYASGLKGRQYLSNCHVSGYDKNDPTRHFTFLFDQLMMGGGVGANYSNRYLDTLPPVSNSIDLHIVCRSDHPDITEFQDLLSQHKSSVWEAESFVVEDSREGWTRALGHMLSEVFSGSSGESSVIIDVSNVRRRGSPLVTSGGIACGPGPLVQMLTNVCKVINGCVGTFLRSLDVMSIDHYLADCVVAGGKRRSSRMSVKNWADHDIFEFINCKRVDGSHWTTNISVEVDDAFFKAYESNEKQAHDVARQVTLGMRLNGEPGYWNRSLSMVGESENGDVYSPNPCGEIALNPWENCNLGSINMGAFTNRRSSEMKEAMRLLTRWLIRATNGDMPHPEQKDVVEKNRRIGAGLMGFHEYVAMRGIKYSKVADSIEIRALLNDLKTVSVSESKSYSRQLGIPEPVKHTCIAPTGTTALLPGTTSAIQCMMAPWFKRLVRYSSDDPELKVKKSEGYESFVDEDSKNTEYIVYWCEDPLVAKVRAAGMEPKEILEGQSEIGFEASLKVQAMVQECFADNAISFTINLEPESMPTEEEMEHALISNLKRLKGTTVFPNKSRRNNPIQPVTKAQFDSYSGPKEIAQIEDECKGGACPVK